MKEILYWEQIPIVAPEPGFLSLVHRYGIGLFPATPFHAGPALAPPTPAPPVEPAARSHPRFGRRAFQLLRQTQLRLRHRTQVRPLLLSDPVPGRGEGEQVPAQDARSLGRRPRQQALGYFVRNVSRMKYGTFRAAGWFIGSGVVEVGCKTLIGGRSKQSGMFWSKSGAKNILAPRCIHSSRRLEEFWKYRFNQHTARNNTLPLAA